jgi:hypothetical protein
MSFEELKAQVDALGTKIEEFEGEVNRVKIISQRTARDSKAYGALNQGELETFREETDGHFRVVHSRLDAMNALLEQNNTTLNLLYKLMQRNATGIQETLDAGPPEEGNEDPKE